MGKNGLGLSSTTALSVLLAAILLGPGTAAETPPERGAVPLARYWEYARASADWAYHHQAEIISQWQKGFDTENVFGYRRRRYRQDYFHNRLCVRPEKIWMGQRKGESRYSITGEVPGQAVLDFLRNAGSYRRVRTQKVDFLTFEDFDYSRTRLKDDDWGYDWDRAVVYIKDPELFIVFDVFKARREE